MMVLSEQIKDKILIGWNEWCALPALFLPAIKAKIDTGAKTSALHAFNIADFRKSGNLWVGFDIHPVQRNKELTVSCQAEVIDKRAIMSSNGHKEHRFVIATPLRLGGLTWTIELTLSDRDPLAFRMLLGREAMRNYLIIDPHRHLCQGDYSRKEIKKIYMRDFS